MERMTGALTQEMAAAGSVQIVRAKCIWCYGTTEPRISRFVAPGLVWCPREDVNLHASGVTARTGARQGGLRAICAQSGKSLAQDLHPPKSG